MNNQNSGSAYQNPGRWPAELQQDITGALPGPLLMADPLLTIGGWCGALLIFAANAALALRR